MYEFSKRNPLLIIFLSVMVGIIFTYHYNTIIIPVILLIIGIIFFILSQFVTRIKIPLRFTSIIVFFIGIGSLCMYISSPSNTQIIIPHGKIKSVARIENLTDEDTSMKIELKCISYYDSLGKPLSNNPIKLYTTISGNDYSLKEGNLIKFDFRPKRIKSLGNPHEFDFAYYMFNQGYLFEQYISADGYEPVGTDFTLFTKSRLIQRKLINKILSSSLDSRTQQFIITALLGENSIMDSTTREAFSRLGISHTLALSGLHIGIIVFLLSILLYPLDYFRCRNYRYVITLLIIIVYGFITGLSPSVCRAIIMATFLFVGLMIHRDNNSLNSLSGAGLLILLFAPLQLFQVGFQMSFCAVAAIILLYKHLNLPNIKNKIFRSIIDYSIISICAVLGTGVLTIYYFHNFPISFLFFNLIIIPILPIILFLGLIFLVWQPSFLIQLANNIYLSIYDFVTTCSNNSFTTIEDLYIDLIDVVLYYSIVIVIIIAIKNRNLIKPLGSISILLAMVWFAITYFKEDKTPISQLIVFNHYYDTPIVYFESSKASHIFADTLDMENTNKRNKRLFSYYNTKEQMLLESDTNSYNKFMENEFIGTFCNKRIAFAGKGFNKKLKESNKSYKVDILLITDKYYGKLEKIDKYLQYDLIVLSGGVYEDRAIDIIEQCKNKGYDFYNIRTAGAFILDDSPI